MGGAYLCFEGKTPEEVKKRLAREIETAQNMGLYLEDTTEPEYDERKMVWRAGAQVHT